MDTFLYLYYSRAGSLQAVYLYDGEFQWFDFPELRITISDLDDANVIYDEVDYNDAQRRASIGDVTLFQHLYSNDPSRAAEYLEVGTSLIKPVPLFSYESLMAIAGDRLHRCHVYWLEEIRAGRVALENEIIGNLSRIQGILNRARHA